MKLFNIVLFNEYERVIFYPIIYFKKIEFEKISQAHKDNDIF